MWKISAIVVVALGAFAAPAAADYQFRTPSGNIGCYFAKASAGSSTYLRCDIRSGLRPKPPRPRGCVDLDLGDSYEMGVTGRVLVTCHGDTAIDPTARVLRYGSTWRGGGFTCTSKTTGLRCRNRRGHGWFMSRRHSYRF